MDNIHGKSIETWQKEHPVLKDLMAMLSTRWFNPQVKTAAVGLAEVGLGNADIVNAAERLKRFAPYFIEAFPDTHKTGGILESPLTAAPLFKRQLTKQYGVSMPGSFWLKQDSHLPISGSIKARGGIYEVLQHAEALAIKAGKLSVTDNYAKLYSGEFKQFFSQYSVAVGSTGNLGLSIGIMSAALGFKASVHMSADARQWKKDKLRSHGVTVVEYASDYSEAVKMGRMEAAYDSNAYFVDDENSKTLFVGYAVAAHRLEGQLRSMEIVVDEGHPLFVYLPCGVGGGPGGVAFGLKSTFGDNVHCIFCEPTHCPSMFLGVYTGLHSDMSVQDFGIDNKTAADGLACGRPSGFVGRAMQHLIDGYYTMTDEDMFRHLALCLESDGVFMEPSSATSLSGPLNVLADKEYLERMRFTPEKLANATHLAWITGGNMVPEDEKNKYINKGKELLHK